LKSNQAVAGRFSQLAPDLASVEAVMDQTLCVYMTAASAAEATRIGRALVEERLAACVNVLGGMHSIYRWQGAVEEADEVAMIAKTTVGRFAALERRARELHGYDVPCVVAWPHSRGNGPFLDWIRAETAPGT
jgi:periplasmic divalent cation tolerance protein